VTKQSLASHTINDWHFDPLHCTLSLDDANVELTPLQSGLLGVLIDRHPELVSATELLELLDEHAQGNRNKLYQSIAKLRKVFGDSSHNPDYIQSVARKGYCLLPTPKSLSEPEQISQSLDDVEVHSGVLEQNIFDDLGFISDAGEVTEDDEHQNIEVTGADKTGVEGADAEDKKTSVQEEAHTPQYLAPDKSPIANITASKIPTKAYAVIAIIVMLLLAYGFTGNDETQDVMTTPEVLYIAQVAVKDNALMTEPLKHDEQDSADNVMISQDAITENVGWWITQKLQHLPLIEVKPSAAADQYPLFKPLAILNNGRLIAMELEYWLSKQQKVASVRLELANVIDAQATARYLEFNQRIIEIVLDSVELRLSNDICVTQDFVDPVDSDNEQCLIVLNAQSAAAHIPENTIKHFPNNSLGYYLAAKASRDIGQHEKAMRLISTAMERNTNASDVIKLKSELHRQQAQFSQSLMLTELLIGLEPSTIQHHYWYSYDLMALGYRERAVKLLTDQQIDTTSISDTLYFNPLNYNTIKGWFTGDVMLPEDDIALIRARLTDSNFKTNLMPEQQLATIAQLRNSQRVDRQWQQAALYLANSQLKQAKDVVEQEEALGHFIDTFSLSSDDRIFYLPTYANILLQSEQPELANGILQRFILLAQTDSSDTRWTLALAEAYALDGQPIKALGQLSKLLATGWLPHPERQLWTLRNNPNFVSLRQQWEFLNLLELIENRQKLMLMELGEVEGANLK